MEPRDALYFRLLTDRNDRNQSFRGVHASWESLEACPYADGFGDGAADCFGDGAQCHYPEGNAPGSEAAGWCECHGRACACACRTESEMLELAALKEKVQDAQQLAFDSEMIIVAAVAALVATLLCLVLWIRLSRALRPKLAKYGHLMRRLWRILVFNLKRWALRVRRGASKACSF